MAKIFVSHSTADADVVERVKERLAQWGYQSVFLAPDPVRGPAAGEWWRNELYRGIADAQLVLVLWSENFRKSTWGMAEVILADFLDKRIVPVRTDPTPLSPLIESRQAVEIRQDSELSYKILFHAIKRILDPADDFTWDPRRSPFPGLEPFEAGDAAVYFGRNEELAAVRASLSFLSTVTGTRRSWSCRRCP